MPDIRSDLGPLKLMVTLSFRRFLQTSSAPRIGFIGLGQMGSPMAKNLLSAGQALAVYDLDQTATKGFPTVTTSVSDLSKNSDIIISMLPNGSVVKETYMGQGGVFESAKKGTFLIDCSTIEYSTARFLNEKAMQYDLKMIDAPVSGGVMGAEAGSLTFMIGGSLADFSEAAKILVKLGKRFIHCGSSGNGQIAKACNNMMLGITMAGLCETFILAQKLGLDAKTLSDVINSSSGRSWSSEVYNPVPGILPDAPSSKNYAGGFTNSLLLKDLKLALAASKDADLHLKLGKEALEMYDKVCNDKNFSAKDFSSLYKYMQTTSK